MPTAAKLVSALLFALVGYCAAVAFLPSLPEGKDASYLAPMSAFIGLLCGWFIMGNRVGVPLGGAIGQGMSTSVYMLFFVDLLFSVSEMLIRSMERSYRSPTEGMLAIFENLYKFGLATLTPEVLIVLFGGGAVAGLIAELVGRRWR